MSGARKKQKLDVMKQTTIYDDKEATATLLHGDEKMATNVPCSSTPLVVEVSSANPGSDSFLVTPSTINVDQSSLYVDSKNTKAQPRIFAREKYNLEAHQLIWLDVPVNDPKVHITVLRKIVDYTKLFDNVEECLSYLQQTPRTTTFLVCSDHLSERLISKVDGLKNIHALYVYCSTPSCAISRTKIKQQRDYTEFDPLLNDLTKDVEKYCIQEQYGIANMLFSNVFGKKPDNTTDDANFSWWKYFIHVLCFLPYPRDNPQKRLVDSLKDYCQGNESNLKYLEEFEETYSSDKALWWYTRPIFLSGILNRALREHHIELTFMFGFFIQHLYQQLKQAHGNSISNSAIETEAPEIQSFRGQVMSRIEMESLFEENQYNNQRIIINSFFSTSLDREVSSLFLPEPNELEEQLVRVIFEITSNIFHQSTRPFANITRQSAITEESEILFMTGAHFDLEQGNLTHDELNQTWTVKLKLREEYFMSDEKIFAYSSNNEKRALKNCLATLPHCLRSASAEDFNIIFRELFQLYPSEVPWMLAIRFHCLARSYDYLHQQNYQMASMCYGRALEVWLKYVQDHGDDLNCSTDIGNVFRDLGWCYQEKIKNNSMARKNYDHAIKHYQSACALSTTNTEEHIDLLNRLSDIYVKKMNISENELVELENCGLAAIKLIEKIQNRMKECTPIDDSKDVELTGRIARLYSAINKYDDALCWYKKAVEIESRLDPICFYSVNELHEAIIEIYMKHRNPIDYYSALEHQLEVHKNTLTNSSVLLDSDDIDAAKVDIARSRNQLSYLCMSINEHTLSDQHRRIAEKLYEERLSLEDIAAIQLDIKSVQQQISTVQNT